MTILGDLHTYCKGIEPQYRHDESSEPLLADSAQRNVSIADGRLWWLVCATLQVGKRLQKLNNTMTTTRIIIIWALYGSQVFSNISTLKLWNCRRSFRTSASLAFPSEKTKMLLLINTRRSKFNDKRSGWYWSRNAAYRRGWIIIELYVFAAVQGNSANRNRKNSCKAFAVVCYAVRQGEYTITTNIQRQAN